MLSKLRTFWNDESGAVLPYATVLVILVIIPLSLLSLDGARFVSLSTQLQSAADALALAGAAELNGAPGARNRATTAINKLLANQTWQLQAATPAVTVPNDGIVFYETIPSNDKPLSDGTLATDDGHARFVAVTVTPQTAPTYFPVSLVTGGANQIGSSAQAVAGFKIAACQLTPMFICNPFETTSGTTLTYDQATAAIYNQTGSPIVTLQEDHNGQFFPGNFGFLQSPNFAGKSCGSGNNVAQALAQTHPPACFVNTQVSTKTGNITPASDALNTRFDLWNGSFNSCSKQPDYPPDQNVRKGYAGTGCSPSSPSPAPPGNYQAMGLPPDNNQIANGAIVTDGTEPMVGNGQWACGNISATTTASVTATPTPNFKGTKVVSYTTVFTLPVTSTQGVLNQMAFSGQNIPSGTLVQSVNSSSNTITASVTTTSNPGTITINSGQTVTTAGYWSTAHPSGPAASDPPAGCTSAATISRESVSQYEVGKGYQYDASTGGEVGNPTCNTKAIDTSGKRREINVAVINCQALKPLNGMTPDLPVAAFVKFYLTAPVASSTSAVYGEWQGVVTPGSANGDLYYQVQLYR